MRRLRAESRDRTHNQADSPTESIARGLPYEKLQCAKCHGVDGHTRAVATTFEDDWRQPLAAANLTEP